MTILPGFWTVPAVSVLRPSDWQDLDILSMTPVWAVEVPDRPGGLAEVLAVLAENHVDVEYMYSLFAHQEGKAYMVMRIHDEPRFLSTLGDRKIRIMTKAELNLK